MEETGKKNWTARTVGIAIAAVAVLLVLGTWWTGQSAQNATQEAVHSISSFFMNELTGRREQVVTANLNTNIRNMQTAIELMTPEDTSDEEHLQAYQAKMKKLYDLEKFAFVDTDGVIYTSLGRQDNIAEYDFDYRTMTGPEISVKGIDSDTKKAIIAIPVESISLEGKDLVACFMEIDMQGLLDGFSLQSDTNETTFCNIYTADGVPLTNFVLGGLASEDNLLDALKNARFEDGYSLEKITDDFQAGHEGIATFTYNGILETLDYDPIEGTDWILTYLIRESVISNQVSEVSQGIMTRNLIQLALTILALVAVFGVTLAQTRQNARIDLERREIEAESRIKQEEMEQRLALQEQLLEQEQQRAQQDRMITALASDYRGVYYVDLETDECVCYQSDSSLEGAPAEGERFSFHDVFSQYAVNHVAEEYRDGFLEFINPESILTRLEKEAVIGYRYLMLQDGRKAYEILRMAGVRHAEERAGDRIRAVGVGFADVDRETRDALAQRQALRDALTAAEDANKAKTVFLSNMSHEIRTPMNAIIGLDSIALADQSISVKTREYLEKIGDSARHLLSLINDILDASRIESGRMVLKNERFSLSRMLEQVNTIISTQCNEKGLTYRCRVIGHVDDHYIGDDTKLRQSLINILGNAVKFTPEGGSVEFSLERTARYEGNTTLRFVIADNGIGMSEEFIPHIFETFKQEDSSKANRYGNTGLGMAITKSIIEMMNGNIEVESTKGEGSTFTVTVTLKDSELDLNDDGQEGISPQSMSVLVIDDDPVACEHAKLVLETVGIAAETAQSGAEAIEMVRLRDARRSPFNLILVDWKMPEMDGVETTRRIREIVGSKSAIIILTAYNWDDVLEEAKTAGVDSFLAKPLFATNVLEEFQQALKRKNLAYGHEGARANLAGRRILLAEDMLINAEILKELMSMREVEVEHAENGRIAVDMFAEHPVGYYDAVLMDIRMPEMDGLEATMAIRALDRDDARTIPIIALTANAFDEDVQQSLQAGLNAHLSKPIEPDALFETLETLIPA